MKQTKMQWVQYSSHSNEDNFKNVGSEVSSRFRKKKKENLEAKMEELENNSKIKVFWTCIGTSVTLRRVASIEPL